MPWNGRPHMTVTYINQHHIWKHKCGELLKYKKEKKKKRETNPFLFELCVFCLCVVVREPIIGWGQTMSLKKMGTFHNELDTNKRQRSNLKHLCKHPVAVGTAAAVAIGV